MKKFFSLLLIAVALTACDDAAGDKDLTATENGEAGVTATPAANALTTIEWTEPKKDLGTINEGQKLQIAFRLKNTGSAPLVLQSVVPGCGCTVADYPKEPIAPGKEAEITASFDSQGREGQQHKEITVTANTQQTSQHTLSFNVMVVKAKS